MYGHSNIKFTAENLAYGLYCLRGRHRLAPTSWWNRKAKQENTKKNGRHGCRLARWRSRLEIELAIDMMHYLLYWQSVLPPGAADAKSVLRDGKVPQNRDSTYTGFVMSLRLSNMLRVTGS